MQDDTGRFRRISATGCPRIAPNLQSWPDHLEVTRAHMNSDRQTAFDQPNRSAEDIFEILVSENAPMLIAYIRSIVWRSEVAEDLFQETMIVAWRRLDDFDRTRPFAPWLRGIALRICLAHRRKHARDMLRCDHEVLESLEARFKGTGHDDANSFRDRIRKLKECMKSRYQGIFVENTK